VLFILIPTAWLAVLLFALTMCRVATISDDSDAVALAELIAMRCRDEDRAVPADTPAEQLPTDPSSTAYRATA
jgi:hypothetical protein